MNFEDDIMDEDAELQRVLEISRLEEEERQRRLRQTSKKPEVIVVTDSEDESDVVALQNTIRSRHANGTNTKSSSTANRNPDRELEEGLARAIAASAAEHDSQPSSSTPSNKLSPQIVASSSSTILTNTATASTSKAVSSASLFLAERAKLERERLARQKRLRPDIAKEESSDDNSDSSTAPPTKRQKRASPKPTAPASRAASTSKASPMPSSSSSDPMYWEGEIRQTANRHAPPPKDIKPVFRLTEIIGSRPNDVKLIIMGSYCNDLDWLDHLLPRSAPKIIVNQPGPDGNASVHTVRPNWIQATPFLPNGRGCMHMKFMLIFYSTGRLRVMISTANFIGYDWRDIENTAWVQDLPLRSSPIAQDPNADDFPARLEHVLKRLHVTPAIDSYLKSDHPHLPLRALTELRTRWDWSKVTVQLVASIQGKSQGRKEVVKTGHTALSKAIVDIGGACPDDKELVIECQGSSIGTYSASWLNEIYSSAKGQSLQRWFGFKETQGKKMTAPTNIKILFPSLNTVDHTALGREGGGTMFCRPQQWNSKTFPKQLFHDSKSKRGPMLMHSKMILGTFVMKAKTRTLTSTSSTETKSETESDVGGWCYIGSHNFTPSAWGNLSGSASAPVINVANYELGIVLPLPAKDTDKAASEVACWERPPPKYRAGVDEPWMQDKFLGKAN